ncbi:MAG: hypothetical protein ABI475_06195 [Methylophilaceae bacterium]
MKNHTEGMSVLVADTADAMPEVYPIYASRTLHRPVTHSKDNSITLP